MLLVMIFLQATAAMAAICVVDKAPLEAKIRESSLIFTGKVIADESMKEPSNLVDRVMRIKVDNAYKGEPGKEVSVYYKVKTGKKPCESAVTERKSYLIKEKKKLLFYTKVVEGVQFTSQEIEGGSVKQNRIRSELSELEKLITQK